MLELVMPATYTNDIDRNVFAVLSDLRGFQRSEGLPATGCLMLKLRARVPYTMRKTGNPYVRDEVEVEYTQWGMAGADWGRCVNNAIAKATPDGETPREFVAKARAWGQRVEGTPFVVHTPQGEDDEVLYWPMVEWVRPNAPDADIRYYVNGEEVTDDDTIAALRSFHTSSKRHTDAETTEGDRVRLSMIYRSPRVRHLRAIQAGGIITIEGTIVYLTHRDGRVEAIGTI
jgi:hypothetical protein